MVVKYSSGIGRPLNLKYPTNRAIIYIVLSSLILGILAKLAADESFKAGIVWAFRFSTVLFLTWAIAREFDPDSNTSAFISIILILIAILLFKLPALLPLFWLILITRILNRITGITPKPLDLAGVIVLTIFISWPELWVFGLLTSLVLFVNSWMDDKKKMGTLLFIIVITPILVLLFITGDEYLIKTELPTEIIIAVAAFTTLIIPVICTTNSLNTLTDITKVPISVTRLRAARLTVLVTGIIVVIMQGDNGFYKLLPIWMVILAVSIVHYGRLISHHIKDN